MKLKEYSIISNMIIECRNDDEAHEIIDELVDALIEIVERRDRYCGGGFRYEEIE